MENPEKKKKTNTGALIGAIAAIVLCGVNGLCTGPIISILTFTQVIELDWYWGILFLCLSVIFLAIGVVVPIVLLKKKKKKEPAADATLPGEPLPPAS